MESYQYTAFISYKHCDGKMAGWLHRRIERYRLPSRYQEETGTPPRSLRPIFRDISDLSGGVLRKEIEEALIQSEYLIVICSPSAPSSTWISREIQAFIDLGRADRIIPFIIDGIPYASDPRQECLPPALKKIPSEQELLAINVQETGKEAAATKVIARLLRVRFDELWQRQQRETRRRRRALAILSTFLGLILLGLLGFGLKNREQRRIAEFRQRIFQQETIIRRAGEYTLRGEPREAVLLLDSLYRQGLNGDTTSFEYTLREALASFKSEGSRVLVPDVNTFFRMCHDGKGERFAFIVSDKSQLIQTVLTDGRFREIGRLGGGFRCALSEDGAHLLLAEGGCDPVRILDIDETAWQSGALSFQERRVIIPEAFTGHPAEVGFSPEGTRFFITTPSGSLVYRTEFPERPELAVSHDGSFLFCTDSSAVWDYSSGLNYFIDLDHPARRFRLEEGKYLGFDRKLGWAYFLDRSDLSIRATRTEDLGTELPSKILFTLGDYLRPDEDSLRMCGTNRQGDKAFFTAEERDGEVLLSRIRFGKYAHSAFSLGSSRRSGYLTGTTRLHSMEFSSDDLLGLIAMEGNRDLTVYRVSSFEELATFSFQEPFLEMEWIPGTYRFLLRFEHSLRHFDASLLAQETPAIRPGVFDYSHLKSSFLLQEESYPVYLKCRAEGLDYELSFYKTFPFGRMGTARHDLGIRKVVVAENLVVTQAGNNPILSIFDLDQPASILKPGDLFCEDLKAMGLSPGGDKLIFTDSNDSVRVEFTSLSAKLADVRPQLDYRLLCLKDNFLTYNEEGGYYTVRDYETLEALDTIHFDMARIPNPRITQVDGNTVVFSSSGLFSKRASLRISPKEVHFFDRFSLCPGFRQRFIAERSNQIRDVRTGRTIPLLSLPGMDDGKISFMFMDTGENYLGLMLEDNRLLVFRTAGWTLAWQGRTDGIHSAAINAAGLLAVRQRDGSYALTDIHTDRHNGTIPPLFNNGNDTNLDLGSIDLSPDGLYFLRSFITADNHRRIGIWSTSTGRLITQYPLKPSGTKTQRDVRFSEDGRFIRILLHPDLHRQLEFPLFWGNREDLVEQMKSMAETPEDL